MTQIAAAIAPIVAISNPIVRGRASSDPVGNERMNLVATSVPPEMLGKQPHSSRCC